MNLFVILLLALAAGANAAFSRNLLTETHPRVAAVMLKVRFTAQRSDTGQLGNDLVHELQHQIDLLLEQIHNTLGAGHSLVNGIVTEFQNTYNQLLSLSDDVAQNAEAIFQALLENLQSFWTAFFGKNRNALAELLNGIASVSSDMATFLHEVANQATNLANLLNIPTLLQNALSAMLPANIVQIIMNQLNLGNRGYFSDLVSAIYGQIANLASSITDAVADGVQGVQDFVFQFINEVNTQAITITDNAAQQFLDFLKPYQQDLGALYDQIVAQLQQIIGTK